MRQFSKFRSFKSLRQAAFGHASKLGHYATRAFRAVLGTSFALAALTGLAGPAPVNAQGDTNPTVTIAADRSQYILGIDHVWFTLTRTGSTTDELRVTVTGSQTEQLSNVFPLTQFLFFNSGERTTRWRVNRARFLDSATQSGDVTVTLQGGSDYDVGNPSSATVRMVVADPAVTVRIEEASYRFVESASETELVLVARTAADLPRPNKRFGVKLESGASGDATAGVDYTALSETVEFAPSDFTQDGDAWQARKEVTLAIADDAADESDETLNVTRSCRSRTSRFT